MTGIPESLLLKLDRLVRKVPAPWLEKVCTKLKALPTGTSPDEVCRLMPSTVNPDLSFLAEQLIRQAAGLMTWEALGWVLESNYQSHQKWTATHEVELLWSGPSPDSEVPARRIDQSLYDLIATARHEIWLVTFAAARIQRLTSSLLDAVDRGVRVRLLLEFELESEGQLSFDALKAFPKELVRQVEVYYWPLEKRERNQAGRPGKLHAKLGIIDDQVVVSSANLTDDAFNRNLEMGVRLQSLELRRKIRRYLDGLIMEGVLRKASM